MTFGSKWLIVLPLAVAFIAPAVAGLIAPVWHDEALLLLEFAGSRRWSEDIQPANRLQSTLLHQRPGLSKFFTNISELQSEMSPPVYFAAIWTWRRLTGNTVFMLRLFSLVAWIGCILCIWKWANSSWALTLCLVSPAAIAFATLARNYALACLWIMLCGCLLDPDRRANRFNWLLGGIAGVLAVWTHFFAAFPIAVIFLFRFVHSMRLIRWRPALLACAAAVFAAGPLLYLAKTMVRPTKEVYPGALIEAWQLTRLLFRIPLTPGFILGRFVDWLGSSIFLAALLSALFWFRSRSRQVKLSLSVVLVHASSLWIVSTATSNHLAQFRYLALVLPFCCVLIADLCRRLGPASVYAICATLGLAMLYSGADTLELIRLQRTQSSWSRKISAGHGLVIASTLLGPAVPAVILTAVPGNVDFLALPEDEDPNSLAAITTRYSQVAFCPTTAPDVPPQMARKSGTIRLLREYSCYAITTP